MPHHFYLPQLSGENISVPKVFGHWSNNERKVILGIGDSIALDEQVMTRGVSSIPDIWARPLLFQSALRANSHHPLKQLCVQEWRGLLSLLALHKVRPNLGGLEIVPVELDGEKFSTALRNLAPSPVQLERKSSYAWTDILMIRFGGLPLGAFSPTTLVYSATDYHNELKKRPFPFKDENGFLRPPTTKEEGLEFVGEWLDNLKRQLNTVFYTDQANPDHLIMGNINELLEDWLQEIREVLHLRKDERIDSNKYKVDEEMIEIKEPVPFLPDYNVYKILLHALRPDDASKDRVYSDILFRPERNDSEFKHVIVITEKLLSSDVNIWGGMRTKDLGDNVKAILDKFFNAPWGTKIDTTDIGVRGAMWIRPELYFISENLLKARSGPILKEKEKNLNTSTDYILPFRQETLQFFSAANIRDLLKPEYKYDGGVVKFSFLLPMEERVEKVEKVFRTKSTVRGEGNIIEAEVPVLEIFPDNLGANWRRYYLFNGMADRFTAVPLFNKAQAAGITLRTSRGESPATKDLPAQQVATISISGDSSFPEAIALAGEKGAPYGLILMDQKKEDQGLKRKWTVGIDFGTSNTNVYKRIDDNPPVRWKYNFQNYYRSLTESDPRIREHILEERFFPNRDINLPIPSTLKVYNFAQKDNMVLDYFIFYPREFVYPENVLSEMKWDTAEERKTEYFLESLLFLLLIEVTREGAAEVILACSFPKAFSQNSIDIFIREWKNVFKKCLRPESEDRILDVHRSIVQDSEKRAKIQEPKFQTEGIAAGYYFSKVSNTYKKADIGIAALCLDVGGGTTDISLWHKNNIEFDASVRLAGRQISDMLQMNSVVSELLFSKAAAGALEGKRKDATAFAARLNLILKTEEYDIQKMLVRYATNEDIVWFRQILALEFSALVYFTGLVCAAVDNKSQLGLLDRIAEGGIKLHWGGNAAKLINWIDFGGNELDPNGTASKLLNAIFFNCLKGNIVHPVRPKSLEQLQSPEHKSEASGGLVVDGIKFIGINNKSTNGERKESKQEDNNFFDSFPGSAGPGDKNKGQGSEENGFELTVTQELYAGDICGENIELAGRSVGALEFLSNKDLFDQENNTYFKRTSLDHLLAFVEMFNFFSIRLGLFTEDMKVDLTERDRQIIRDNVYEAFIDMQEKKESSRQLEPLFIIELKILLNLLKSKRN